MNQENKIIITENTAFSDELTTHVQARANAHYTFYKNFENESNELKERVLMHFNNFVNQ